MQHFPVADNSKQIVSAYCGQRNANCIDCFLIQVTFAKICMMLNQFSVVYIFCFLVWNSC